MRLAVPFVESGIVHSMLRAEGLARRPKGKSTPLPGYSSEGPQPGTGTKGSQLLEQRAKSFELYTICLILKTSPKVSFSHFIHKTSKLTAYELLYKVYTNVLRILIYTFAFILLAISSLDPSPLTFNRALGFAAWLVQEPLTINHISFSRRNARS